MIDDSNPFMLEYSLAQSEVGLRELNIHTSDRISFKRCRRKWNWSSPLRMGLRMKEQRRPLWFGTGVHFVMEDYHGHRVYSTPAEAWEDYVSATYELYGDSEMPTTWRGDLELGRGMLSYYETWLKGRDPLETLWIDGVPQNEVNFKIPLPIDPAILERLGVDVVYYNGTLDGVCLTPYGNLAIREYKTAAAISKAHFLSDPQVTAYSWGAQILYNQPIVGCYYYQFLKDVPEEPGVMRSGRISTNKQMRTTARMYRSVLQRIYGDVRAAPADNVDHLNYLTSLESADSDKFITRDFIARNQHTLEAEGVKIMMEIEDMLNPDLPLYPNPTRECSQYRCDFLDACTNIDDGSDWESILEEEFQPQKENRSDKWRQYLKHPKPVKEVTLAEVPQSLQQAVKWVASSQSPTL